MLGILAKKQGMTQIFNEDGRSIPVTILSFLPGVVSQVKTVDSDGYNAVQIACEEVKDKVLNKAKIGHFKKVNLKNFKRLNEFRTDKASEYKVGDELALSCLEAGDEVVVIGQSIGKGFQGVMKRYGFGGGPKTHGCSVSHRVPGSIGQNTSPGKVFKGKKMAGHMGVDQVTVKGVKVEAIEEKEGLILVKGPVPGSKNSLVFLKNQNIEDRFFKLKNDNGQGEGDNTGDGEAA